MCGWRISGARESCAAAMIGTSRSRASIFSAARDLAHLLHAVVAATAAALHELQVVDDHEVEAAELLREPAQLRLQLPDRHDRRVVDVDLEPGQLAVAAIARRSSTSVICPRRRRDASTPDSDGEQALGELLARHLDGEDGDARVLADGGVAREVQQQRRLADARPRRARRQGRSGGSRRAACRGP